MSAIAAAVAIRTADIDIAQELHLDFFESSATTPLALALRGIEAESTAAQAALAGQLILSEKFPNLLECSDINHRIRTGRFSKGRLVNKYNPFQMLGAFQRYLRSS